jgi:hypothetical protein
MPIDKYKADVDQLLMDLYIKNAKSLKYKNTILFSQSEVDNGNFKKIAFDMYKVQNDPYNGLWVLEEVDGVQHLVRASDPRFEETVNGEWSAISDYDNKIVTLSYKNIPITNFFSDEYGYSENDIGIFKSALIEKVRDEQFVSEVFKQQPGDKVKALAATFPELSKFIK